jgi:hypothetical protein
MGQSTSTLLQASSRIYVQVLSFTRYEMDRRGVRRPENTQILCLVPLVHDMVPYRAQGSVRSSGLHGLEDRVRLERRVLWGSVCPRDPYAMN